MFWRNFFSVQKKNQAKLLNLAALVVILISIPLLVQNVQKRQELRKMAALPSDIQTGDVYPSQETPTPETEATPTSKPTSAPIYIPGVGVINLTPTPTVIVSTRYRCNTDGSCVADPNGPYTTIKSCDMFCEPKATLIPTVSVCKTAGSSCDDRDGTCGTPSLCSSGYHTEGGLCPGGSDCVCCLKNTTTVTPTSASTDDSDCTAIGGICKYTSEPCGEFGTGTYKSGYCSGPTNRQCCVPSKATPTLILAGKPTCYNPNVYPSTSGTAPFSVVLNPQGDGGISGIAGYQWDINGDGSWDVSPTLNGVRYTFKIPGTYNVRMRVLANNGQYSNVCQTTVKVSGSFTAEVSTFPGSDYACEANGACAYDPGFGAYATMEECVSRCVPTTFEAPTGYYALPSTTQKVEFNPQRDEYLQAYLYDLKTTVTREMWEKEALNGKPVQDSDWAKAVNEYVIETINYSKPAEQYLYAQNPNEYVDLGKFAYGGYAVCLEQSMLVAAGLAAVGIKGTENIALLIGEFVTPEGDVIPDTGHAIVVFYEEYNEDLYLDAAWKMSKRESEAQLVYLEDPGIEGEFVTRLKIYEEGGEYIMESIDKALSLP